MKEYTSKELTEALRAINSIISKCEKAQENFRRGILIIRFLEIV